MRNIISTDFIVGKLYGRINKYEPVHTVENIAALIQQYTYDERVEYFWFITTNEFLSNDPSFMSPPIGEKDEQVQVQRL